MAEIFAYREGLLNKLASSMGVSTEVAKSKAIQIADSYQTMLKYVNDDTKAKTMVLQSSNVFGVKVDESIFDMALTYVRQFEGNIASDGYVKQEKANTPIRLDNLVSKYESESRRVNSDYSRRTIAQAAGSTTLYTNPIGPLFTWAGRNLRRIIPSRETFADIRAYVNRHPRHTIYLSGGALAIAGLLSFGYMQGVKPIISFYTGKAKPAVVRIEPQPKPIVSVAPAPAPEKAKAEEPIKVPEPAKPAEPKVIAPEHAPAAVPPAPAKVPSLEELAREVNALKQQVTQYGDLSQQVQELRAKLEAFEKDYVKKADYDGDITKLREELKTLEGLVQKAGAQVPTAAAPTPAVVQKDEDKRWVYNQATEEHKLFIEGKIAYARLTDRVKAWFSLKHPKAELKQEGDKYSIAVTPITTYKRPDLGEFRFAVKVSGQWHFGLNPNEVAMVKLGKEQYGVLSSAQKPVGQLIMYNREGDILRIFASLNYERVPKVIPPAPRVEVAPTPLPKVELPPRVVEPELPKPTYKLPLEPEDITEPRQKVPLPPLRLEPSRPLTKVPLVPEAITEPKTLQVR